MQINVLEDLFQTTKKFPDKIAVIDETRRVTYAELTESVTRIGEKLYDLVAQERQVSVIVFIDKSIDCLEAMFATLYSGHFYVVVDVKTPPDRFREIVAALDNKFLVTTKELETTVSGLGYKGTICTIEDIASETDEITPRDPWKRRLDVDLAYVLFTSGSTGTPKGVATSHRSIINYMEGYISVAGIKESDVLGNQSQFFFDASLKDTIGFIKTGATLCIIPTRYFVMPKKLLSFLEEHGVTAIAWVPTAYSIIAQFKGLQKIRPSRMKIFVSAGETLPVQVYNYWKKEYPDGVFIQLYGPTETTGVCCVYEITRVFSDDERIPIGKAFPNTEIFLLDENGKLIHPTSAGQRGEIYIRGSRLAAGYFNNPERTEAAFVQNPLNDKYPEKVYKTGDLGYWNELKELVFVSRVDFQIKHSGHRIELGEIDNGILAVEGIDACCCVQDRAKDEIVCFYVGTTDDVKKIIVEAGDKLPKYMIPTRFCKVDALPVTASGKTNRKALDAQVNA